MFCFVLMENHLIQSPQWETLDLSFWAPLCWAQFHRGIGVLLRPGNFGECLPGKLLSGLKWAQGCCSGPVLPHLRAQPALFSQQETFLTCPSISRWLCLAELAPAEGLAGCTNLNPQSTPPGGARVGVSGRDWVVWLWSRGHILLPPSLSVWSCWLQTGDLLFPSSWPWSCCPTKLIPCVRVCQLRPARAHSTVFPQKVLEEKQATSGDGRVADRCRQISGHLGPFTDLPLAQKWWNLALVHSLSPPMLTQA